MAAFDSRMRALDPAAQSTNDDDELIVDDSGSDLAQNINCPITLVPVRVSHCCHSLWVHHGVQRVRRGLQ